MKHQEISYPEMTKSRDVDSLRSKRLSNVGARCCGTRKARGEREARPARVSLFLHRAP